MNEIQIERNEDYGFLILTCSEGHYISNWNKVDILEFTSAKKIFCPADTDTTQFYCLTEEEHNELVELQRQAIEQKEKENRE